MKPIYKMGAQQAQYLHHELYRTADILEMNTIFISQALGDGDLALAFSRAKTAVVEAMSALQNHVDKPEG